jgi:hypothetical protein
VIEYECASFLLILTIKKLVISVLHSRIADLRLNIPLAGWVNVNMFEEDDLGVAWENRVLCG